MRPRVRRWIVKQIGLNCQPADLERRREWDTPHPLNIRNDYDPALVERALKVIRESGVAESIDRKLHVHPGVKSHYGSEGLILTDVLTTMRMQKLWHTKVVQTIASLPAETRFQLNLYDPKTLAAPTYRSVSKQRYRLINGLNDTWVDENGEIFDLDWFDVQLTTASIPEALRRRIGAASIDGTSVATRAAPNFHSTITQPTEIDEVVESQKAIPDSDGELHEIIAEEKVDRRSMRSNCAGTLGSDGRRIDSADPDARWGWHTSSGPNDSAGYINGYEAHFARAIPGFHWWGDPTRGNWLGLDGKSMEQLVEPEDDEQFDDETKLKIGLAVQHHATFPGFYLGSDTTPQGWHRGTHSMNALNKALVIAPNINDVLSDRGITNARSETFRRPIHERGINCTMDYSITQRKTVKTHHWETRDGGSDTVFEHCGTFLHQLTYPHLLNLNGDPKAGSDPDGLKRTEYSRRAQVFRLNMTQVRWDPGHGAVTGMSFQCPFCARRAKNASLNPMSVKAGRKAEYVNAPEEVTRCCCGRHTVDIALLDNYQAVPFGTGAWAMSYGRRNHIENFMHLLRSNFGYGREFTAASGLAAHKYSSIIAGIACNIDLVIKHQAQIKALEELDRQEELAEAQGILGMAGLLELDEIAPHVSEGSPVESESTGSETDPEPEKPPPQ